MIRLYRAPWSTNVERVALALAHKGLAVESVVISYEDRSPIVAVSGQPLVPVLEDGGRIVHDSTAILRYLEATYPDPPLFPREPVRLAELDIFLEWFNEVWKRPPNEIEAELAQPHPDQTRIAVLSARIAGWLGVFEGLLDGRDHLLGPEFSAADCIAYPFLKYARSRDPRDDEPFHRILQQHQPLGARHPRLGAWINRVAERPQV